MKYNSISFRILLSFACFFAVIVFVQLIAQGDSSVVSVEPVLSENPSIGDLLSIDFKTMSFMEIMTLLIPVFTLIWGQIAKLLPSIDDAAPFPKWLYIVIGGFVIAMSINFQGFDLGTMIERILLVLAGAGVYPGVKALHEMSPYQIRLERKVPTVKNKK